MPAIGRHFDVEDIVLDGFDLERVKSECVSEHLRFRQWSIKVRLQPFARDFHGQNWLMKRRSAECIRRMSSIPHFNIAMRSIPQPNAKPRYLSGSRPPFRMT